MLPCSAAPVSGVFPRAWLTCLYPQIPQHRGGKLANFERNVEVVLHEQHVTLHTLKLNFFCLFLVTLQFRDCREEALKFLCAFMEKVGDKVHPYACNIKVGKGKLFPKGLCQMVETILVDLIL